MITDLIPKTQQNNQNFENIKYILSPHNLISKNEELQETLKELQYNLGWEAQVVKGVHFPSNDSWHFNITVKNPDEEVIEENLHVYVIPIVIPDESGNPTIFWIFDGERQIT
jgi:hypothetical protein